MNLEFNMRKSDNPLFALAIHDGHEVRSEVRKYMEIDEFDRLREEDPVTGYLAEISDNYLVINTSRFEVDVNRSRFESIYRFPVQSWGLKVWSASVKEAVWDQLLLEYDFFYHLLNRLLREVINKHGYVIVYDFHTYNHKREKDGTEADRMLNPEINIGTGIMERDLWAPAVNHLMGRLRSFNYFGRNLDVRENIKFKGGYLSSWVNSCFPGHACVLSIEVKKFFMDESTGAVDFVQVKKLREAFRTTIPGMIKETSNLVINGRTT